MSLFPLNSEQKALSDTLAAFAQKQLAPKAEEIDEKEGFNKEAFRAMAELGLLGITVKEELGGTSLGCVEATLAMERMGEACASTTLSYLAHTILCVNNIHENASDTQKKRYLPAILSGVALAFARAVGEFGSVVLISGNLPFKTGVVSVYVFGRIESGDAGGAAAASVVILAISFAVLLAIGGFRRWVTRHDR